MCCVRVGKVQLGESFRSLLDSWSCSSKWEIKKLRPTNCWSSHRTGSAVRLFQEMGNHFYACCLSTHISFQKATQITMWPHQGVRTTTQKRTSSFWNELILHGSARMQLLLSNWVRLVLKRLLSSSQWAPTCKTQAAKQKTKQNKNQKLISQNQVILRGWNLIHYCQGTSVFHLRKLRTSS